MFQGETSDMLPREAPKPTAAPTDEICKPIVPEVSMVFGQQNNENQQQLQQQQIQGQQQPAKKVQSYAAWKKQMLPQVVYPPSERENFPNIEDMPLPMNNLYPFRPPLASLPQNLNNNNNNSPLMTPFGTLSNQYIDNGNEFFRRSISSAPPMFTHPLTVRSNTAVMSGNFNTAPATSYQQQQQIMQRRSLDAMANMNNGGYRSPPTTRPSTAASHSGTDVLTICAGTQTDNQYFANGNGSGGDPETISPKTLRNFATKSDMEKLLDIVQQIREDQMRLISVCEVILLDQQQQLQSRQQESTQKSDSATQYENQEAVRTIKVNGEIGGVPNFQSPRPTAQSTAYQANTPTGILRQRAVPQPKATDKTLTMNELALKYLPSDKLNELLHDMQLTGPKNAITERVILAAKSPNDISNASYKYLKKYRLLPDEQIPAGGTSAATTPNNGRIFHMESQNQWQQEQRSPFEARATDSPILISRRPSNDIDSHDDIEDHDSLNLEELRNKPKFL